MDEIVEDGYVVIGTPDEVAEQLHEAAVSLNVGHLMLLQQFGNMNKALTTYNTRLFAEAVAPKLRGLFSEWDDPWWPRPLPAAARETPAPVGDRPAADSGRTAVRARVPAEVTAGE
jgi:hypothetical protein